ncbi:DUF3365 domain-containing protein [Candidatus Nitronereus thalassa]|uniref:DUF3365 domain-containing protein n=1 Tax=Candidatus Nitronereus thalassa TaxID=3020898 RepID=A0ABU3K781_9BACT|nr:DUF3365 domain-containing protein [Candidatus Nitronereus thalassa]MDT7042217.1 DUF3365 domain-containing protein [Candidatus Nitronereus thalassa]
MKNPRVGMFGLVFLFTCWMNAFTSDAKRTEHIPGIPPDVVASYIHSIIQADRTIYSSFIVNRLHENKILDANEAWEQTNSLLLPAQFLQKSGRLVAEHGTGIRFRLISLWPIYERNGPVTDFERKGLKAVENNPDQPYSGVIQSGKISFFQAIYADQAVTASCVNCHNTHPLSPKRNFKLNDVMGAIVITIPLPDK